jgi:mxaJ protein
MAGGKLQKFFLRALRLLGPRFRGDDRSACERAAPFPGLRRLTGLLAAALTILLAVPASARELRVCADPNNLPFSNARGEGFENKLAELVAADLGAELTYVWQAQRRGFIRETLKAGRCDLVPGIMVGMEMLRTTAPYYRSSYVFVTRTGEPSIGSLDDPALRSRRIGVQLIGDDGANTPPAHALARRGIIGNISGYMIYGDYAQANPPARIVEAVAFGEIDVAVVWGPLAGYFAPFQKVALTLAAVEPQADGPRLPMVFDIGMGVRPDDRDFRDELNGVLNRHRAEIDALLALYGVPRLDAPEMRQAGRAP